MTGQMLTTTAQMRAKATNLQKIMENGEPSKFSALIANVLLEKIKGATDRAMPILVTRISEECRENVKKTIENTRGIILETLATTIDILTSSIETGIKRKSAESLEIFSEPDGITANILREVNTRLMATAVIAEALTMPRTADKDAEILLGEALENACTAQGYRGELLQEVKNELLAAVKVMLPQKIVSFLDTETTKVDRKIRGRIGAEIEKAVRTNVRLEQAAGPLSSMITSNIDYNGAMKEIDPNSDTIIKLFLMEIAYAVVGREYEVAAKRPTSKVSGGDRNPTIQESKGPIKEEPVQPVPTIKATPLEVAAPHLSKTEIETIIATSIGSFMKNANTPGTWSNEKVREGLAVELAGMLGVIRGELERTRKIVDRRILEQVLNQKFSIIVRGKRTTAIDEFYGTVDAVTTAYNALMHIGEAE